MSLDKLKLSKRLHASMQDLGFSTAKEIQLKALPRIIGGHNIVAIAPEGAGKTTTYVLGVLMRLKHTEDEAPKVLILAPNEERIAEIVELFYTISQNKELYIMGLKASGSMEEEIEQLVLGVDIVVATPNRARNIYLKLGLNLNRIQTFIIDNAQEIVKQGMQTNVRELAQSCGQVQYLAFSTVEHDKLHLMIDGFMPYAAVVEAEELGEESIDTHELMLYHVTNFTTKINLLNTLMADDEVFDKVVVFVNKRTTAQNLINRLHVKKEGVSLLDPLNQNEVDNDDLTKFKQNAEARILFIANEENEEVDLSGIPFIFHFEVPANKDVFVKHVLKNSDDEAIAITFATDIELPELNKIEQYLGKKIPVTPLPDDLIIYRSHSNSKEKNEADETQGGAFHKKKESNSKTYNYGGGTKAKMTMKNKKI